MCSIGLVRMGPLYIFRPKELGSTMFYQIKHRYYISKSGVRPFVGKCATRLCAPVSVMVAGKGTTSINHHIVPQIGTRNASLVANTAGKLAKEIIEGTTKLTL